MLSYLFVALGSALGGMTRFAVGGWIQRLAGGAPPAVFPVGTLAINATGSFVIGLLAALITRPPEDVRADAIRLLVGVGFCGGYTTFSTFSLDTFALFETRGWTVATLNVLLSVGASLAGVGLGLMLGRAGARLA